MQPGRPTMGVDAHAKVTAVATLALMVMGSLVHGTGSSLACPDWPLCHGTAFPAMVGGVQFEHTHRLMAAAVVVLVVSLFYRLLRAGDRAARWMAGAACALVVLQAALGALTVLYRLPPVISIAHLATSMTFLAVVVSLAARLAARERPQRTEGARKWSAAAGALVFGQIVLGAAVRHLGAVLACAGVPLCNGTAWPSFSLGRLHMLHRLAGVLALLVVLGVSLAALRRARSPGVRALALTPAVVAMVQVGLGVGVVLAGAPLDLVTVHHAGGALLLASLAAMATR